MKQLILFPLLSICMLQLHNSFPLVEKSRKSPGYLFFVDGNNTSTAIGTQTDTNRWRMPAAVFKNQEYCRAEIPDFAFDVHFKVVGATVYFTGTNFKTLQTGTITSNSLKPISNLMERCAPGSIIVFDDFKVIGPDNKLRTIQGMTITLY